MHCSYRDWNFDATVEIVGQHVILPISMMTKLNKTEMLAVCLAALVLLT